ncbi:MAG: hypothetical protein NUW37_01440 [Planctomycetes bacterium]|nr:hypothetical protein [Planctomycetota bacterium]
MVSPIFQRAAQNFAREVSQTTFAPGATPQAALSPPMSFQIRFPTAEQDEAFRRAADQPSDFASANRLMSGPLHAEISGRGYFKVTDGETDYFQRQGAFTVAKDGRLVSLEGGLSLEPEVRVPTDSIGISIDSSGVVSSTNRAGRDRVIGQINLVEFPQGASLRSRGKTLFENLDDGAKVAEGAPGSNGFGRLSGSSQRFRDLGGNAPNPVRDSVTNFARKIRFVPAEGLETTGEVVDGAA